MKKILFLSFVAVSVSFTAYAEEAKTVEKVPAKKMEAPLVSPKKPKAAAPAECVEPAKPAEPATPAERAKPAEAAKAAIPAEAAKPSEAAVSATPAEPAKPAPGTCPPEAAK